MSSASAVRRKFRDLTQTMAERKAALRANRPVIGYVGWMGHGNLGDDAMWQAACGALPQAVVTPYDAPQRERLLARLGLSGSRYFHSVILGGGTLISPQFFPPLVETAISQNIPIWSWGTGVGSSGFEMGHEVDLSLWKPLLPHFQAIGVRGPLSQSALTEMEITGAQVVGDLALSLSRERPLPPERAFALNLSLPAGEAYLDKSRFQFLEAPIAALIQDGWRPVPLAMTESDIAPTAALLERIMSAPPPVLRPARADDFFDLVAPCVCTVGVRLHAAVLSCCVGVPPIMIGYRSKCLDFMTSMQLSDWHLPWDTATSADLGAKLEAAKAASPALRQAIIDQALAWKYRQQTYVQALAP